MGADLPASPSLPAAAGQGLPPSCCVTERARGDSRAAPSSNTPPPFHEVEVLAVHPKPLSATAACPQWHRPMHNAQHFDCGQVPAVCWSSVLRDRPALHGRRTQWYFARSSTHSWLAETTAGDATSRALASSVHLNPSRAGFFLEGEEHDQRAAPDPVWLSAGSRRRLARILAQRGAPVGC